MLCAVLCDCVLCVPSAAKAAQPERALEVDALEHGKHQEVSRWEHMCFIVNFYRHQQASG